MKSKLLSSLPLVGCLALASCYQIPDKPRASKLPKKNQTVSSEDQQKIQEQRDQMKETEAKVEEVTAPGLTEKPPENTTTNPTTTTTTTTTEKPAEKPRSDYAFANPVPGKAGFVFSPYNQKLVDVRDIPSGTLVQDPTYPPSEKKYFRVP